MFFQRELALAALPELGPRTRAALERLLPGPVTLLVPNPARRFPLACGPDAGAARRARARARPATLEPLAAARWPVLQSSANPSGGADARRLADVDERIRAGVDLQLDGGELPGTPSTVIDLTALRGRRRRTRSCAQGAAQPRATSLPRPCRDARPCCAANFDGHRLQRREEFGQLRGWRIGQMSCSIEGLRR